MIGKKIIRTLFTNILGNCYALDQINNKGYALPYLTGHMQVVKIGISFNTETRTIDEWVIAAQ